LVEGREAGRPHSAVHPYVVSDSGVFRASLYIG
jgi:hypothetical protein